MSGEDATAPSNPVSAEARHGRSHRLSFEHRLLLYLMLMAAPGSLVTLFLIWEGDFGTDTRWTVTIVLCGVWLLAPFVLRDRLVFPLQTLSNLMSAYREGDYSIRVRRSRHRDVLGHIFDDVNSLGDQLSGQRVRALDATNLLRKVMEEIDVAVFTFDQDQHLALVNRAGAELLAQPPERLLGREASDLGLAEFLNGVAVRTVEWAFPGRMGRWGLRRTGFRERGLPHRMIVLADLSQQLREEERKAWRRLLRVLGHELNNSLAPIKSMASTLERMLGSGMPLPELREDMEKGLGVIAARAQALNRFMVAYSKLARLPEPSKKAVLVRELIHRVVSLEQRARVLVEEGPAVTMDADADQLEQLLINLIRNAVDAVGDTDGQVGVSWSSDGFSIEVRIEDDGPGLPDTANLFVPFFTTKPGGTGIGLALSRQIAEAHGGTLTLENRTGRKGCVARLRLPM
ncbi:MAG: ATP-binding protein [Acidobacteriota bacterium]